VIAALLLAAGASRRFGGSGSKLLQELNGKAIVRWSAEALIGGPVDEVIAVVPPDDQDIRRALAGLDVRLAVNAQPERGIASSIACGVSALGGNVEAALIALGDEPTLSRDAVARVVRRYRDDHVRGIQIVAPVYRGTPGHPTLFTRMVFDELRTLAGDRGARDVIHRDTSRVAVLELDVAPPGDVDTVDDLARMRRQAYIPPPPPTLQRS
jgi:molybdenum cofactor cytidylyltransferase